MFAVLLGMAPVEITPIGGALIAVSCVAALLAGKFLFQKDTEVEHRRRAAIDAGSELKKLGFVRLPGLFTAYAVGDYSGLAHGFKECVHMLLDPAQRNAELSVVFANQLAARLADPDMRGPLLDKIEKLKAMHAPTPDADVSSPVKLPTAKAA